MSEPYENWSPALKFFDTMNGRSEYHTNAFFQPDPETMVLVDMSLLNAHLAERFIVALSAKRKKQGLPPLKNFYVCITHNHYDHSSGVGFIAYAIKIRFPGSIVHVITDERIAKETLMRLNSEGCSRASGDDAVYQPYFYREPEGEFFRHWGRRVNTGDRVYNYDYIFEMYPDKKPDWLVQTIPTEHSLRLDGASGFVFKHDGKLLVYSGDTNQIEPYAMYVDDHADDEIPIEFYLDMAVRKSKRHLCFPDVCETLHEMMYWNSNLKIVLMHYDDKAKLRQLVKTCMPDEFGHQIFLAEKEDLKRYCQQAVF